MTTARAIEILQKRRDHLLRRVARSKIEIDLFYDKAEVCAINHVVKIVLNAEKFQQLTSGTDQRKQCQS